jgi:hypothetical protein
MLQWLRFADAAEGFALCVADELVDPFHHAFVMLLPVQVVVPCLVCNPTSPGRLPFHLACSQLLNGREQSLGVGGRS